MINTLGPRVYQQPVVRSVMAPASSPQPAPQAPALPQAQSAGSDFGAMLLGFFSKLGQAVKNFVQTLFAPAQANQAQGVQSVNTVAPVAPPAQPAFTITAETRAAAMQALPHLDILAQHVAMLKPTLDLLQVKKPSPNEILSFLTESKIALTAVSQGQQPNFRAQTVGVADLGNDMLRFSSDTLGVVLAAKGLAGLFKVNDANFLKTVSEIESGLMSVRTAADILARNPV
ncbi:hypothetical protein D3C87_761650 [compost metagenome]